MEQSIETSPVDLAATQVVTGKAQYTGDVYLPNLLYAKVLRSPYAHARIQRIDFSRALAQPGVVAGITYSDIPRYKTDRPFLTDKARFVGDAVAAIAATDSYTAQLALYLIDVDWVPLPAVFDPRAALEPNAPLIHDGGNVAGLRGPQPFSQPTYSYQRGDFEAARGSADIVLSRRYRTQFQCHTHIEPHTCTAIWYGETLTVWNTVQSPYSNQRSLAEIFDLKSEQVRVICPFLGGGYGGKDSDSPDKNHYDAIAVALARKSGRPVRLEVTNGENLTALSGRNPFEFDITLGAKKNGEIVFLDVQAIQNTGAYSDDGPKVLTTVAGLVDSTYKTAAVRFSGSSVYTNCPVGGEMWGYGAPQITFALERIIDDLAYTLELDPLTLRQQNHRKAGDPAPGLFGKVFSIKDNSLSECLSRGADAIAWKQRWSPPHIKTGDRRRGLGVRISCESTGRDGSNGLVHITPDGTIRLPLGTGNMGTGSHTTIAMLVAGVLKVPLSSLSVFWGDTEGTAWDYGGDSSRGIHCTGQAFFNAALDAKQTLLHLASTILKAHVSTLDLEDGHVVVQGAPDRKLPFSALAAAAAPRAHMRPWFGGEEGGVIAPDFRLYGRSVDLHPNTVKCAETLDGIVGLGYGTRFLDTYGWAAQFAEVEVDLKTGAIDVLQLITATDVGRVINLVGAQKQVHGGSMLSLGFALREELMTDPNTGVPLTREFRQAGISPITLVPATTPLFIEKNTPNRFPAKGLGETSVQAAAAIANAVYNATGVSITALPITARRLLKGIENAAVKEVCSKNVVG